MIYHGCKNGNFQMRNCDIFLFVCSKHRLRVHLFLLYADDSAILVADKHISNVEKLLKKELETAIDWLIDNKLSLHLGKTESILFGSKIKLK